MMLLWLQPSCLYEGKGPVRKCCQKWEGCTCSWPQQCRSPWPAAPGSGEPLKGPQGLQGIDGMNRGGVCTHRSSGDSLSMESCHLHKTVRWCAMLYITQENNSKWYCMNLKNKWQLQHFESCKKVTGSKQWVHTKDLPNYATQKPFLYAFLLT